MKILAIVASARKTGNSEILAREMLAALPESVDKKLIRLTDFNIEPCRACYACLPAGKNCVIQDDFEAFLQQVRDADSIILASPVYFLGMHTRLKLLCDRLISVLNETGEYSGRRCVVAVPYGIEGWQGYGIEATVSFARFLHLDVVGVLPVHAANPGEVVLPEVLARARAMAELLLANKEGSAAKENIPPVRQATDAGGITCGRCGSCALRISTNGGVRCVICGTTGAITSEPVGAGGTLQCSWNLSDHFRYSAEGMTEHAQRLESIKADFIARRQELAELRKPYKGD